MFLYLYSSRSHSKKGEYRWWTVQLETIKPEEEPITSRWQAGGSELSTRHYVLIDICGSPDRPFRWQKKKKKKRRDGPGDGLLFTRRRPTRATRTKDACKHSYGTPAHHSKVPRKATRVNIQIRQIQRLDALTSFMCNCVILKIDYFICSKLTLIIFGIQSQIFDFFVKKEKIIIQMILIQQFFWNMSDFLWENLTFFLGNMQLFSS